MSLAEQVSARITYKAYATGAITSNTQPVSSSDPAATGGQILRRTTSSLSLSKDTYQSQEVRTDRQIVDFRHGTRRVQGSITGELSPGTYFDLIEAACRGTKASAVALSNTELTSAAADNSASTFTFGGGDPVSSGLRVGMPIRFTNLSESTDNNTNYLITGFSGASNRTMAVYPAPTTMTADTSFNVTSVGKRVYVPSSAHVSRKFAFEVYHSDLDIYRMFTECRIGGIKLGLPATGMSTIEIPVVGRDMETGSGASAPFFTSPTAATSTGILAAVNGLVRIGGVNQGVITGATIGVDLGAEAPAVVGQNIVPEVFLKTTNVSGQITAFFEDLTLVNAFKAETEIELLFYLLTGSTATADAMTVYLPRVKFGNADVGIGTEAGVPITLPFTALKYSGSGAGIDTTVIAFCDTAA